ncbi:MULTISPECIES: beta-lactamase hydrolase domain-containing protein [unclassified Serratia (in: enterobacteria)]|uniref:beta-lactamase hydrolase domain-containing protein n=1 Tax=unclassified Serratia (in: enterobacteria) TaxID=2647522 RepID=UPI000504167F|nr:MULTISPECIES: sulfur transferase domain-containing protein [unclassified Serratia (in: enterobacteria)]KFK95709.1 hypothetical protein JV45_06975 [Serratia sp. Ag2]KFK95947.1 hypothetical protein IV04_19645 [Serratia sp. Ag1]
MKIRHANEQLSFADALNENEFLQLHEQGYEIVVNNRPDEEIGDYLLHTQEKVLAQQQGIEYIYMPFTYASLTWEMVYAFNTLLKEGKKILAHCRTGSRSATLYLLHDLRAGLIDEHQFREYCRQYEADADRALAWYADNINNHS